MKGIASGLCVLSPTNVSPIEFLEQFSCPSARNTVDHTSGVSLSKYISFNYIWAGGLMDLSNGEC